MFNQIGNKYPELVQSNYLQIKSSAEASTLKDLQDAFLDSFYSGNSVGQNPFTGDKVGMGLNTIPTDFKTRKYVEEHGGEFPPCKWALLA